MQYGRTILCALLVAGLCALGARAVAGDTAVERAIAALGRAKDPDERLRQVRRLQLLGGERASAALARLVGHDPVALVRAGAARALGFIASEDALELLLAAVVDGGPRIVRVALAEAVRRRAGEPALLARLADRRAPARERPLLLAALGSFADEPSLAVLVEHAGGADPALRDVALRALAVRADGRSEAEGVVRRWLENGRTPDELHAVLDVAELLVTPDMKPGLERVASFLDPALRESATWLLDVLRVRQMAADHKEVERAPEDRYGKGSDHPVDEPPPTPPGRARFDFVYVLDATGSTVATLPLLRTRILEEMALLVRLGSSVRVGVVAYRGGRSGSDRARRFQVLPPSYDPQRVRAFLEALESGGVDDRGASVALALEEALACTPWRWNARRSVQLFADSRCDDASRAALAVGVHFDADRTRTGIAYVLRTRTKMPPEYADLARLGGTGAPELLK